MLEPSEAEVRDADKAICMAKPGAFSGLISNEASRISNLPPTDDINSRNANSMSLPVAAHTR